MIPVALSAAHAAVVAWKSKIDADDEFRLAVLDDADLAQLRRAVAALYDEVRDGLDQLDTEFSGRIMVRSPRSGPGDQRGTPGSAPPGLAEPLPATPGATP